MMGFVHHEHSRQPLGTSSHKIVAQLRKDLRLMFARNGQCEVGADVLQELARRQTAIEYIGIANVAALFEQLEYTAQQQRLSRTYLAGKNDKSFVSPYGVIQRGQRLVVSRRREEKSWIRADFEWVPDQVVERLVHEINP